jgi:arylsulfatase A-like enzyme
MIGHTRRLAVLLAIVASELAAVPAFADRPNILLIVSDDQGYNDLGLLNSAILTPNLDRLAREGVRLTNFYVAWPACTPSRGSLLTGRYPQRNGVYDMIRNEAPDYGHKYTPAEYEVTFERIGGMDTREVLIPQVLKSAGYVSGIYGKWDLGALKRFLPLARGFDDFYGFVNTGIDYYTHERYGVPSMYRNNQPTEADKGTYCTTLFEREALRFLKEHGDRPFFLYVPFNAPHNSSSLDPEIRGTVQAPLEYENLYPPVRNALRTETRDGREARVPTVEKRTRDYRAAVTCMDASIGKLLDVLDERGLAKNTLVMFLSDNGGSGGADNAPLRGGKGQTWEGGIRVLSLIRWPAQLPAGVVNDEFLTTLEVLPTLIKAAGAAAPQGVLLDGFDMLPALKGEQKSPRQEMFWKRRDLLGARVGNWKWVDLGGKAGGLFDLENDPGERHDHSQKRPDVLRRVKGRYQAWLQAMEAAEPRGPFRDY